MNPFVTLSRFSNARLAPSLAVPVHKAFAALIACETTLATETRHDEGRRTGSLLEAPGASKGRESHDLVVTTATASENLLPPERGLPSRERQIPKNLILLSVCLFVCLSVCPDFG